MIEVVNKLLNQVFGNKSDKDIKELLPIVNEINQNFESYVSLTNDQLRGKTYELRARIKETIKEDEAKVAELKSKIEDDNLDIVQKEEIYAEIDSIDKNIVDQV